MEFGLHFSGERRQLACGVRQAGSPRSPESLHGNYDSKPVSFKLIDTNRESSPGRSQKD